LQYKFPPLLHYFYPSNKQQQQQQQQQQQHVFFSALFQETDGQAPKVHLLGLLTSDISSLSNLVIPNVDIRFELKRNIPEVNKMFKKCLAIFLF